LAKPENTPLTKNLEQQVFVIEPEQSKSFSQFESKMSVNLPLAV